MRLSLDTGDSGLKRMLKEVKANNRILREKATALCSTITQLTKQLELKTHLQEQIKEYEGANKNIAADITRGETEVSELMKQIT